MASFRYFTGPMDCGKSTLALQIDHTHRAGGRRGRLLTCRDRAGTATISSRLGLERPAVEVHPGLDVWAYVVDQLSAGGRIDYLVCDETQFYTAAQVDDLARLVDELDIDVFAVGILTDFQTHLFPGSRRLVELCDSIEVLQVEALCWCGRRATHNARTVDGLMVVDGAQVVVGDTIEVGGTRGEPPLRSGRLRGALPAAPPVEDDANPGPGRPGRDPAVREPAGGTMTTPRDRVLVEPEALAAELAGGRALVLLDVRGSITGPPGRPQYEAGHLPGAVFVDLESELSGPPGAGGRHPLPDPAAFEDAMRAAGVDDQVAVVAYDGAASLYAARLWWLLTDAGHADVRVLDGGYAGWVADGLPVETGPGPVPRRGSFVAHPGRRERVDVGQLEANLGAYALVDVRSVERFRGETEPIDPVAGHIPGALNRPAAGLLDERSRFRPAAEVAAQLEGIDAPVFYCGSGITAAQALLAMEAAGLEGGRIYPGSWSDWIRDPSRSVATGEEPSAGEPQLT